MKTPTKGKVIEYLSIQLTINLNLVSLETASFLAVTFDVDFKSTQLTNQLKQKKSGQSGVGGCPLNARNFNFSARVAMGSAKEKLKFGFSGGLFALLFAQTKSKKNYKKEVTYPLANLVTIPGRFLRNDFTFFINIGINKTYIKCSVKN